MGKLGMGLTLSLLSVDIGTKRPTIPVLMTLTAIIMMLTITPWAIRTETKGRAADGVRSPRGESFADVDSAWPLYQSPEAATTAMQSWLRQWCRLM